MAPPGLPPNRIGITMGCPVGIGPEIIVKMLASPQGPQALQPVVLGDAGVLRKCVAELAVALDVVRWQPGAPVEPGRINVLSLSDLAAEHIWGAPNRETGRAMGRYIEEAVRLIQEGELAAMVTCPITKTALQLGGYNYPGHTEMLASLCNAPEYAMMMAGARLRVSLVTIHTRLADVPGAITRAAVLRMIAITGRSLQTDFALAAPRIAVAGLNPHGGEAGLFGDEESRVIGPAIDEAQSCGWRVSGPYPPDTVFSRAAKGDFDAVVAMYHDQGLIPFKLLHFADGVNVTLGLPIVRTSVDHGTAYDIAGKGKADPASLRAAFALAGEIVANRRKSEAHDH